MTKQPRLFYGWVIVACSWLANFVTTPMSPIVFAFFIDPMSADLHVSRTTLVWGITVRQITGGLFAPVMGRIIDRYGSRWAGFLAGLVIGLVLIGFGFISNIWVMHLLFAVSGLAGFATFGGNLLTIVPVSNWFVAKRGRAVSMTTSGTLLGLSAMTLLSVLLIDTVGWRLSWSIMGVMVLVGVLPAYGIFMRRNPEDMGLLPDGAAPTQANTANSHAEGRKSGVPEPEYTLRQATRTRVLWGMVAVTTLMQFIISPLILFRVSYWNGLGFTPAIIAIGVALDPFVFTFSNLFFGFVAERMPVRFTAVIGGVWRMFGMMPLVLGWTWPGSVLVHNMVWGTGSGATGVAQNMMFPDYFGRKHQGSIRGFVTPIIVIGGALGAPLGGYLLDSGVSYFVFFLICVCTIVALSFSFALLRPPPRVAPPSKELVAERK